MPNTDEDRNTIEKEVAWLTGAYNGLWDAVQMLTSHVMKIREELDAK